jgi:hypothetical protein
MSVLIANSPAETPCVLCSYSTTRLNVSTYNTHSDMTTLSVITTLLLLFFIPVQSQQPSDSNGGNPSIYRGPSQYKYHGCYNETTQTPDSAEERALTGGSHLVKADKMTVPLCLEFCASNGTQYRYAGLEWSRYVPISSGGIA